MRFRSHTAVVFALVSVPILIFAACATPRSGASGGSESGAAQANIEERRARLRERLPGRTRAALKFRAEALVRFASAFENRPPALLVDLMRVRFLEGADRSRPVYAGLAEAAPPGYARRVWTAAPGWRRAHLPAGLHVRLLLPASDLDVFWSELRRYCRERESASSLCRRKVQIDGRGEFVAVELGMGSQGARKAVQQWLDARDGDDEDERPFGRDTPALRAFLRSNAALAVHAKPVDLWMLGAALHEADVRRALQHSGVETWSDHLLKGQVRAKGGMLHDPEAAEFEDIALLFEPRPQDETDAGVAPSLTADLVASHTARGVEVYGAEPSKPPPRTGLSDPAFRFASNLPLDRVRARAKVPFWLGSGDAAQAVVPFSRWGMTRQLAALEAPAGLALGALPPESSNAAKTFRGVLGVSDEEMPASDTLRRVRRVALELGPNRAGGTSSSARNGGLFVEWSESVFDDPAAWEDRLRRFARGTLGLTDGLEVRIGSGASAGQRLEATIGTDFQDSTNDESTAPGILLEADLGEESTLPEEFVPERRGRHSRTGMFDSFDGTFAMRTASSSNATTVQLRLGQDRPSRPRPPEASDGEDFEPKQPTWGWRRCLRDARFEGPATVEAIEGMSVEDALSARDDLVDRFERRSRECESEFSGQSARFREARGRWIAFEAARRASVFQFAIARPMFARACNVGADRACEESERLDDIGGFGALPALQHGPSLRPEWRRRFLLTAEGLYRVDGRVPRQIERVISAARLREAPAEAVETWLKSVEERMKERAHRRRDDGRYIQVAPDALVDADLLTALARELRTRDWELRIWHDRSVLQPAARTFPLRRRTADDSPPIQLRISAQGIDVQTEGGSVQPVEGCPDDGPTICRTADDSRKRARSMWGRGKVGEGREALLELYRSYRLADLYNVLEDLKADHCEEDRIGVSTADDLSAGLLLHVLATAASRRKDEEVASLEELKVARPASDKTDCDGNRPGLFPVPVFP